MRFLRRVPKDPMTGRPEWGLRSVQGRSGFDELGRERRCVRCVFEIFGDGFGRDEVFGLVGFWWDQGDAMRGFFSAEFLARPRRRGARGFTIMELMIVMLIISILLGMAVVIYTGTIKRARESVLKQDLQTMRQAIDNYTLDKQQAPQSLEDLVEAHYLREGAD